MNIQVSQTMRLTSKSPLTSPNQLRFPQSKRHFLSPKNKLDKQGVKYRHQNMQPQSKMLFNSDPLNLAAICHREDGWQSPDTSSPNVDRSNEYEPTHVLPVDVKDPLRLNAMTQDDMVLKTASKRRKRKRRNTFTNEPVDQKDDKNSTMNKLEFLNPSSALNHKVTNEKVPINYENFQLDVAATIQDKKSALTETFEMKIPKTSYISPDSHGRREISKQRYFRKQSGQLLSNRVTSEQLQSKKFNINNEKYKYGNYMHYYSFGSCKSDLRLQSFRTEWFKNKDCLDIGCNTGKITQWVFDQLHPKSIVGVDIDSGLIKIAKRTLKQNKASMKTPKRFPLSFQLTHGPILVGKTLLEENSFNNNVKFVAENYVPSSDNVLSYTKSACYDTILCLSVTKWVQLNFGDDGLKRMFKKIYRQLKPNGRLLLEPQTYASYKKKKNLTSSTLQNFTNIRLMPTEFISYLLSNEVGFMSSEFLCYSKRKKSDAHRPLYVLTKGACSSSSKVTSMASSLLKSM